MHREEVFHFVPGLDQYAQNTIRLASWTGCDTLCHFFLYHPGTAWNQILIIQHLEENLARYVIRVVACQYKRLSFENVFQFQFQEVVFDDMAFEGGKVFFQVSHRFKVQFYNLDFTVFLHQELGKNAHTRPNFQDRKIRTCVNCIGDVVGDT